jgi:two-component system, OmpR family, KDP operon response regulator KdpE
MTDLAGPLLLIVEDEAPMRRFLRAALTASGFRVVEASSGREAAQLAGSHNPDMVILDLGLPDVDGVEVLRSLRQWSAAPVIVLSARGRENDKVTVLDAGADDYLTKPFGVNELLARIRVGLRHAQQRAAGTAEPQVTVGALSIDLPRRRVEVEGREIKLTPLEFKILALLARNAGKVLTHRQILAEVWGPAHDGQAHTLRVHMADLRKKIEAEPARPRFLLTEQGVGYRLAEPAR